MSEAAPPGLEVLQAGGGHGLGNALYLDPGAGALLKVYRPRRTGASAWREGLRSFAHRVFEGKRGTSPEERRRTEEAALRLWTEHGLDVPRTLDLPIPTEVRHPALWLEYCPGETLAVVLADPATDDAAAADLVSRLAIDHGERHRRALETGEVLLLQEHATIVHTLVSGDRLVTIDFENAYRPGFPVEIALADELAGTLRSFFRRVPPRAEALLAAFLAAYPDRARLRAAAERVSRGGGVARRLKRWKDTRRRNRPGKAELMGRVRELTAGS